MMDEVPMRALYTITSQTAQVRYVGNGATTAFSVTFQFFETSTLRVRTAIGDVVTLKVLNTDYTVTGGAGSTGTVTFTTAPPSGTNVIIDLNIPMLQETVDLSPNGPLPAEDVEQAFDRIVTMVKQLRQQLLAVPELDATFNPDTDQPPILPPPSNAKILIGREDELGWENANAFSTETLPTLLTSLADQNLLEYDAAGGAWRNRTRTQVLGDPLQKTGGTVTGAITMSGAPFNAAKGADIASAATVNLTTATGDVVDLTGTTTVTAITLAEGASRTVRTTGILTLTHGASLILPTAANIVTAAGDYYTFRGYSGGVVRLEKYQRANGTPLSGILQIVNSTTGAYSSNTAKIPTDNTTPQSSEGTEILSLAITPRSATSKLGVQVTAVLACNSTDAAVAALFRDSATDAVAAVPFNIGGFPSVITFRYEVTNTATTATTFKVRVGCNTHNTLVNGINGVGAVMNGLCATSITITEYQP